MMQTNGQSSVRWPRWVAIAVLLGGLVVVLAATPVPTQGAESADLTLLNSTAPGEQTDHKWTVQLDSAAGDRSMDTIELDYSGTGTTINDGNLSDTTVTVSIGGTENPVSSVTVTDKVITIQLLDPLTVSGGTQITISTVSADFAFTNPTQIGNYEAQATPLDTISSDTFLTATAGFTVGTGFVGTVTDDTGSPLQDVSVSVDETGDSTLTDAEGRYSLPVVSGTGYTLGFDKTGYIPTSYVDLSLAENEVREINLTLPGAVETGTPSLSDSSAGASEVTYSLPFSVGGPVTDVSYVSVNLTELAADGLSTDFVSDSNVTFSVDGSPVDATLYSLAGNPEVILDLATVQSFTGGENLEVVVDNVTNPDGTSSPYLVEVGLHEDVNGEPATAKTLGATQVDISTATGSTVTGVSVPDGDRSLISREPKNATNFDVSTDPVQTTPAQQTLTTYLTTEDIGQSESFTVDLSETNQTGLNVSVLSVNADSPVTIVGWTLDEVANELTVNFDASSAATGVAVNVTFEITRGDPGVLLQDTPSHVVTGPGGNTVGAPYRWAVAGPTGISYEDATTTTFLGSTDPINPDRDGTTGAFEIWAGQFGQLVTVQQALGFSNVTLYTAEQDGSGQWVLGSQVESGTTGPGAVSTVTAETFGPGEYFLTFDGTSDAVFLNVSALDLGLSVPGGTVGADEKVTVNVSSKDPGGDVFVGFFANGTSTPSYTDRLTLDAAGNGSVTVVPNQDLDGSGDYEVSVFHEESEIWNSSTLSVGDSANPTGSVAVESPITEDVSSFGVSYSFADTTNGEAFLVVENPETGNSVTQLVGANGSTQIDVTNLGGITEGDTIEARLWESSDRVTELGTDSVSVESPATEVSSCTTIDQSGVYTLTTDLLDVTDSTCIRITADNVTFDGQGNSIVAGTLDSNFGAAIYVDAANTVAVRNVTTAQWTTSYGVRVEGSTDVTVDNVTAVDNTFGVVARETAGFTFSDILIEGSDRAGLQVASNASDGFVTNVTATDNAQNTGWEAIDIRSGATNITLDTVVASGSQSGGHGIEATSETQGVTLRNVVARNNDGAGIRVLGQNAEVIGAVAQNNGGWAFAAGASTVVAENLDIGASIDPATTLSFEAENAELRAVSEPATNSDAESIGRYFRTNMTAPSGYLDGSLFYTANDVEGLDEASLALWRDDGTGWTELSGSTVDTAQQSVQYSVTSSGTFGIFGATSSSAFFAVDIVESDSVVTEGDRVEVSVEVTNTDGQTQTGTNQQALSTEATQTVTLEVVDATGRVLFDTEETVTLAAGESTTVNFTYLAGESGELTLRAASEDDEATATLTVEEGQSDGEPEIAVSTDALAFDDVPVGQERTRTVTVRNVGDEALSLSDIAVEGDAFTLVGSTPNSLRPGTSAAVRVRFLPEQQQEYSGALRISSADLDGDVTVSLSGAGVQGELVTEPDTTDFGPGALDESLSQTVTIRNTGDGPLRIGAVEINGPNPAPFGTDAGAFVLEPGEQQRIVVTYTPTATEQHSAWVEFFDEEGASIDTLRLSGEGIDPELAVEPRTIDFGDLSPGTNETQTFTIENPSETALSIGDVRIVSGETAPFVVESGPSTVGPGETVELTAQFEPGDIGSFTARVGVFDTDGNIQGAVTLRGNGTAGSLAVAPADLQFPDAAVGETVSETITLTNDGNEPLEITAFELGQPDGGFSVSEDAPVTIDPGQERTVSIEFEQGEGGPQTTTLRVRTGSVVTPTVPVYLASGDIQGTASVDRDGRTTTQVTVSNVSAGERVSVNVADTPDDEYSMDRVSFRTETDGDVSLNMTSGEGALETTPDGRFELDNTTQIGNFSAESNLDNSEFEEVQFQFRVAMSELEARGTAPEDVSMYRYDETTGGWVEHDTQFQGVEDGEAILTTIAGGFSDWTAAAKRPELDITDTEIDVQAATTDDEITIQVFVTNTGGAEGTYNAELVANDEIVDREDATVPANGTVIINFIRTFDQPGEYEVQVNNVPVGDVEISAENETVDVSDPSETPGEGEPDDTETEQPGDGDGGGALDGLGPGFGIVSALAGVGLAGYLLRRRRSHDE